MRFWRRSISISGRVGVSSMTPSRRSIPRMGRGGEDGGVDYEIFYFDGSTVQQLTINNFWDCSPHLSR
ncbi:MAG: hypothetical protein JW795_15860, partial [Chitinivibrionales bacterium]|nr:hypothetical protein [Chitinivibrionales bacterium]